MCVIRPVGSGAARRRSPHLKSEGERERKGREGRKKEKRGERKERGEQGEKGRGQQGRKMY